MGKSGEEAGKISIHALREEGDFWALSTSSPRSVFLSTPSARRATREPPPQAAPSQFLSTPSARRATGFLRSGS